MRAGTLEHKEQVRFRAGSGLVATFLGSEFVQLTNLHSEAYIFLRLGPIL